MYEAFQDENKDCTTCIDATNFSESSEIQSKIKFLLRENDDLKKQLQNRRIEFELFDEEVKNQLNENARIQELTKETTKRVQDSENCLEAKYRKLETVLKEHLAREKKNITIDSTPAAVSLEYYFNSITNSFLQHVNCVFDIEYRCWCSRG